MQVQYTQTEYRCKRLIDMERHLEACSEHQWALVMVERLTNKQTKLSLYLAAFPRHSDVLVENR